MKNQNSKKTYGIKVRLTSDEYAILTGGYVRPPEALLGREVNYAPSASPIFLAYKNTIKEKASAKVSRALRLAVKFKEYGVTTEKALRAKINRNLCEHACDHTSETYRSS